MSRLILVRHGEASDTAGRCIGHTDVPLSDAGANAIRSACATVRDAIAGPVRIVSSDLQRCRASAEILNEELLTTVAFDPRLREVNFGVWDGRTWDELERTDAKRLNEWMNDWTNVAPPEGESLGELLARARTVLEEWKSVEGTLIAVAHAGWIRAVRTLTADAPLAGFFEIPVDYASVTVVDR